MHGDLLRELFEGVFSLKFVKFCGGVLVEELVDGEETTTDTDVNLVLLNSNPDSLRSKLIDTLALTHEHDLQLLSLRVVVDELSQTFVNRVILHRNVHCNALLKLDDVVLKSLIFTLCVLEVSQELKRGLVGLVDFVFQFEDIVRSCLLLTLENRLLSVNLLVSHSLPVELVFDVSLLNEDRLLI